MGNHVSIRMTQLYDRSRHLCPTDEGFMIGDYDKLIEASCERFFGYGPQTTRVWFIGIQQGGGHTTEEIIQRLRAWDSRGRPEVDDIVSYHRAII